MWVHPPLPERSEPNQRTCYYQGALLHRMKDVHLRLLFSNQNKELCSHLILSTNSIFLIQFLPTWLPLVTLKDFALTNLLLECPTFLTSFYANDNICKFLNKDMSTCRIPIILPMPSSYPLAKHFFLDNTNIKDFYDLSSSSIYCSHEAVLFSCSCYNLTNECARSRLPKYQCYSNCIDSFHLSSCMSCDICKDISFGILCSQMAKAEDP